MEGPTAVFVREKGSTNARASNPLLAFREEVQVYLRACGNLVAAHHTPPPFTPQEMAIIKYYMAEIGKILAVSSKK
jgi:hypothetical protein